MIKLKRKIIIMLKIMPSILVNGIKLILSDIINGMISKNTLLNISKSFLIKVNIIKDVFNERKSKTPHSKWYIQYYASYYRFITLIEALKNKNSKDLNKNLKLIYQCLEIIDK